jgi:glycosyltransferase involved in cell wall biosynthesis
MKILVSAIACDPTGGSEGGVAWSAVCQISKNHDVHVLVHGQYEKQWAEARAAGTLPGNIQASFICEDKAWHPQRLVARLQSWTRYMEFNKRLLKEALALHQREGFDLAHHITYATWRVPSPLWQLPIPFIWGPIGGAAEFPASFYPILSSSAKAFEILRKTNSAFARHSKAFRRCVENSTLVIAANEETETFLTPFRKGNPMLRLPVAFLAEEKIARFKLPVGAVRKPGPLRLFAGGNMIGSKGLSLAVKALALVRDAGVRFQYTIAGGGPEYATIESLITKLSLEDSVTMHQGFAGDAYIEALQDSDIYFLPSFRETTPITMIEAMLAGCYPIVADASAPGEIVRNAGGTAVSADTPEQMVQKLAEAVIDASGNPDLRSAALASAENVIRQFSRENYDSAIQKAYRDCLNSQR